MANHPRLVTMRITDYPDTNTRRLRPRYWWARIFDTPGVRRLRGRACP